MTIISCPLTQSQMCTCTNKNPPCIPSNIQIVISINGYILFQIAIFCYLIMTSVCLPWRNHERARLRNSAVRSSRSSARLTRQPRLTCMMCHDAIFFCFYQDIVGRQEGIDSLLKCVNCIRSINFIFHIKVQFAIA